ncbi:MAG: restriction endonuclease [Blastocatellia bacterium]
MEKLTLAKLKAVTGEFVRELSKLTIPKLYGATDGKAVGTEIEKRFHSFLGKRFVYSVGSAASGIDFPELGVDLKSTSIQQPQSSCPFRDASQKVYGLGYHLLVLVYEKTDDPKKRAAKLFIKHAVFVSRERTADYQTTSGLRKIIENNGNKDDVDAFLQERNLPLDEISRRLLAERILREPPPLGYLTVSNALQWRLQYGRVVSVANEVSGVEDLHG